MNSTFSEISSILNPGIKLSEIININIRAASVLEKYNFDYCCKGNKSIREVCKEKNFDIKIILKELNEISDEFQIDKFSDWRLDFLIDYIINNHHNYIQKMIPLINEQYEFLNSESGNKYPDLQKIYKLFSVIYKDLKQHMLKEEQILFPYIKQLVTLNEAGHISEKPYFGKIDNPINMMLSEHNTVIGEFKKIELETKHFAKPENSTPQLTKFYDELKNFGKDLRIHIHLENNILFPKAIALEHLMI